MVRARFLNDVTVIDVTSTSEVKRVKLNIQEDHNALINRNLPDQHPISAITGLTEALDTIPDDYVSDAELESALLEKQDVISDLATIRSGAALGATAVQPNDLDDYATTQYVDDELSKKQDTLTAGANVQINGNVISATDTTYTAGTGISIVGNVISNTQTSAEWGNIPGTLSAQTDLQNALNAKANVVDIPTATSDLTNDSGFITSAALTGYATQTWVENKGYITSSALTPYALISSIAPVALSGSYNDLSNKPTIPTVNNATLTIQKNSVDIDTFTANASVDKIINITVPTTAADVSALPNSTKYGASIDLSLDTTDYKLTLTLKDQDGTTLNSKVVDFPIESVVVNGSYDSVNQKIVLTLQNGNTIDIPVGALIAGLQTEITSSNKLDADLVDDNTSTNKFVTSSEKTSWDSKQDAISDLSDIRSGASAGATALQQSDVSSTYSASGTAPINGTAVAGAISTKANTGLDNLSSAGQMIIDTQNGTISNCVLEIPQNLNLKLENNVLTLKSGSIITLTGSTYATVTITKDYTATIPSYLNGKKLVIFPTASGIIDGGYVDVTNIQSDSSLPATGYVFFNTTDKLLYSHSSGEWAVWNRTYPICIIDVDSEGNVSFAKDSNGRDMIFNGACFVGHHAVVYPNVRGLFANGKKSSGKLASTTLTSTSLFIQELSSSHNSILFYNNNIIISRINLGSYKTKNDLPTVSGNYYVAYIEEENTMYYAGSKGVWTTQLEKYCKIIAYTYNGTTVTDFTISQPYKEARNLLTDDIKNQVKQNTTDISTKQVDITTIIGYDATKTQTLKNVNGVLTWVDDGE